MEQVMSILKTETTVAIVEGTSTFVIAFCLLKRQQARPKWWPVALRLLDNYNSFAIMAVEKQNNDEDSGIVVYDCIMCLCEVSPIDEYKVLPNCDHGVQFLHTVLMLG
nr:zinc finger, RING/FYVE/PHD-type [Tanacetum cinerariifolium]